MICVLKTLIVVQSFKVIKFKRNLKKVIMISVLDTSSIFQSFQNYKL